MDEIEGIVGAARRARLKGRSAEAAVELERAAEASDDPLEARLLRARAAILRQEYEVAQSILAATEGTSVTEAPDDIRVLNLLGEANRRASQADREPSRCPIHLCGNVGTYRRLARELPRPGDVVIEIGCADGLATQYLARRAALVIALDAAPAVIEVARAKLAGRDNVRLIAADADEVGRVAAISGVADLIFVDVGGSSPPWAAYKLAHQYRDMFLPRAVVIRNKELNDFVRAVTATDEEAKPDAWTETVTPLWRR